MARDLHHVPILTSQLIQLKVTKENHALDFQQLQVDFEELHQQVLMVPTLVKGGNKFKSYL